MIRGFLRQSLGSDPQVKDFHCGYSFPYTSIPFLSLRECLVRVRTPKPPFWISRDYLTYYIVVSLIDRRTVMPLTRAPRVLSNSKEKEHIKNLHRTLTHTAFQPTPIFKTSN